MPSLQLIPIAPQCDDGPKAALRHGKDMVDILNTDERQPDGIKASPGSHLLTPEQFLVETTAWCKRNAALSYIIVRDDECVGMISLSHIDEVRKYARSGWILASTVWGQGLELEALRQIIRIARERGLTTLGGKVRKEPGVATRIWQQLGARFEDCESPSHRLAVLDIGALA
jgi:RimJ/RimL family protein N-acetyltransferase